MGEVVALQTQLHNSLHVMSACDKIIPWPELSAIGTKITEAHHAYQDAFRAHGDDPQEMRKHLRAMCEAIDELVELRSGIEAGLGR